MEASFLIPRPSYLHNIALLPFYIYNVFVNSIDVIYFLYFKIFYVSIVLIVSTAILGSSQRFKSHDRLLQVVSRISYITPVTLFTSLMMMCCVTKTIDSLFNGISVDWPFLLKSFKGWGIILIYLCYSCIIREFFSHFSYTRAAVRLGFCIISSVNIAVLLHENVALFSIAGLFSMLSLVISLFLLVAHFYRVATYTTSRPPIIKFRTSKIKYSDVNSANNLRYIDTNIILVKGGSSDIARS